MAGISSKALNGAAENRFKFAGKEEQRQEFSDGSGLCLYDFHARMYDAQIGRFPNVDPMAHERSWVSPYNYVQNNPINRVDPTGALDDWVQDADGNIKWDKNANSQETTKAGEKYLGKTLTFTFNSYIDGKLWDGPGGSSPAGDKLTSTISLTGNENEAGELTSLSAKKSVKIGETPIGTARDYFPGLGSDQNKFGFTGTTLNFEQHASVSPIEGLGLGLMGYDIVNVAQKLTLSLSGNNLSVTAATDIFPSATLTMNGSQIMHYPQPSFKGTHGYSKQTVFSDNGMGGSTTTEYSPLRPAPSFHIRYKK
jgi:RHS repeat-associated protein